MCLQDTDSHPPQVRIPIGYWAFAEALGPDGHYYTFNQFAKLIEACGWAKKHGLKVWVGESPDARCAITSC